MLLTSAIILSLTLNTLARPLTTTTTLSHKRAHLQEFSIYYARWMQCPPATTSCIPFISQLFASTIQESNASAACSVSGPLEPQFGNQYPTCNQDFTVKLGRLTRTMQLVAAKDKSSCDTNMFRQGVTTLNGQVYALLMDSKDKDVVGSCRVAIEKSGNRNGCVISAPGYQDADYELHTWLRCTLVE